jgi:hypothetical protein
MREALRTQASSGTQGRKWLKPIPRRFDYNVRQIRTDVGGGPGSRKRPEKVVNERTEGQRRRKVLDLTVKASEKLKLINAGDRVAIVARSGRIYVETVTRVADDKIVVARGEYYIRNARKCGDAGCADMLRGLATEGDFLTMRTQSAANTRKRTEQKRQRERKREEQLAKQRELSSLLTTVHASLRPSESCQGHWLLDALTESAVRMIGTALLAQVDHRGNCGSEGSAKQPETNLAMRQALQERGDGRRSEADPFTHRGQHDEG